MLQSCEVEKGFVVHFKFQTIMESPCPTNMKKLDYKSQLKVSNLSLMRQIFGFSTFESEQGASTQQTTQQALF